MKQILTKLLFQEKKLKKKWDGKNFWQRLCETKTNIMTKSLWWKKINKNIVDKKIYELKHIMKILVKKTWFPGDDLQKNLENGIKKKTFDLWAAQVEP